MLTHVGLVVLEANEEEAKVDDRMRELEWNLIREVREGGGLTNVLPTLTSSVCR